MAPFVGTPFAPCHWRDANGEITTWIGTATDIEDQRQLELSLRASEQGAIETLTVLQQIQSAAPWGFCFVDRDFRIRRINESLARVGGISVEEHLGRTVAELVPALWSQIEDAYQQALSGTAVVNLEVSGPSAEQPGRTLHWLTSYYPVRVEDEIIGVSNLIVDITERKEDEEFRAAVMDNMAEGLITVDGDGTVKYMNHAAAKMLGWTEDELRGKPMHGAIHFQHADGTLCPDEDCPVLKVRTEGLDVRVADETFTRKDGTTFPVAYSSAPVRDRLRRARGRGGVPRCHRRTRRHRPSHAGVGETQLGGTHPRRPRRRSPRALFTAHHSTRRRKAQRRAAVTHDRAVRQCDPAGQLPAGGREVRTHRRDRPLGHHRSDPARSHGTPGGSEPLRGLDRHA